MKNLQKYMLLTLLVLLTTVVAACAKKPVETDKKDSDNKEVNIESPVNDDKEEPEEEVPTTKVITDGLGKEVTVPVNPSRIVALHNIGEIMDLGIMPIASTDYYLDKYTDVPEMATVESVGDAEVNFEKILSLSPDLIVISSYLDAAVVEELEKIAPVVATEWGLTPVELLDFLANVLDRQDEKTAWLNAYETKSKEVQEQLKSVVKEDSTAVVIQFWSKNIYQHNVNVFEGLYEGAGFLPSNNAAAVEGTVAISEESVAEFISDADYVFIIVEDTTDESRFNELKDTVWKNVDSVKNGNAYLVKSGRWNDYSTSSMEWIMEDLLTFFAE